MNAKVWIWSAVVLASAGVGVPVAWRNATREAPPEPPDVPAESEPGEELVFAASFDDAPQVQPAPGAAPMQAQASAGGSTGSSLEASLARLERLLPQRSDGALDRLARGELSGVEPIAAAGASAARAADPLAQFLAENPLCGVLTASDGAVALFGLRALRVGESFLEGRARLLAVEARRARVEIDGVVRELELPPLSAHPSALGFQVGLGALADPGDDAGEEPR